MQTNVKWSASFYKVHVWYVILCVVFNRLSIFFNVFFLIFSTYFVIFVSLSKHSYSIKHTWCFFEINGKTNYTVNIKVIYLWTNSFGLPVLVCLFIFIFAHNIYHPTSISMVACKCWWSRRRLSTIESILNTLTVDNVSFNVGVLFIAVCDHRIKWKLYLFHVIETETTMQWDTNAICCNLQKKMFSSIFVCS